MAEVVLNELEKADLHDKIIGLSFDTTASNTGMFQGACMRIEQYLDKDLYLSVVNKESDLRALFKQPKWDKKGN